MKPELLNLITQSVVEGRREVSKTIAFEEALLYLDSLGYKIFPKSWLVYEVTTPSGSRLSTNQTPREVIALAEGLKGGK